MSYESKVLLKERMFMKDSQMDVEFIHIIKIARLSVEALRGPGVSYIHASISVM